MSEYEKLRRKNIEDNKRILAELGLANILPKSTKVTFKKNSLPTKVKSPKPKLTPKRKLEVEEEELGSIRKRRRRSARIQGKEADALALEDEVSDDEDDEDAKPTSKVFRPNTYGAIEGVEIGTTWMMRIDCSRDGIHRPTVAGIHGGPEGAYSIALSGGYDDNIDLGEGFTYTGEGGRDLKGTKTNPKNLRTAPQSKDQTLTRGNLALSRNVETKHPVRVIRGYKLDSPFAPEEGYRYDGLYTVEKCWFTTGLSGFGVWKFALKRCPDQAPPPWSLNESTSGDESTDIESSSQKSNMCQEEDIEADHEDVAKGDSQQDAASIPTDHLKDDITGSSVAEKKAMEVESENKAEDIKDTKSSFNGSVTKTSIQENSIVSDKVVSSEEKASADKENEINVPNVNQNDLKTLEQETNAVKPSESGILQENKSATVSGGGAMTAVQTEVGQVPLSEDNPER